MKYELFYATGGHGGPYEGKAAAMKAAKSRVGGADGSYIDVVPYSQPWEATAVRDLHRLPGVVRVYDRERFTFDSRGLRRYGYEPNPGGKKESYKVAKSPKDKLWYVLGALRDKAGRIDAWLPVSDGFKKKADAVRWCKTQPKVERAETALVRDWGAPPRANPDSHLWHVVDREKFFDLYRELEKTDAQSADLLRLSAQELEGRMEVDESTERAINRLRNLVSRSGGSAAAQRNQVFKIANELGLKLPSYSFNPEDACHHIVACALTPEHREWAIEMMRSGNQAHAAIGAAALGGPCTKKRGGDGGASAKRRSASRASKNPAESIYVMKAGEGNYYARRTTKHPKYLRGELQLPDPRSWGGGMKRAHYRPAGGKLYSRSGLSARFETLKEIKKAYPGDWRKVQ